MTIWLDAQLPPTLAPWLSANFSIDCRAVRDLGLRDADDLTIFHAARAAGDVVILSKDSDFVDLALRLGTPPQILWLTCGTLTNATTALTPSVTGTSKGAAAIALRMLLDETLGIEPHRRDLLHALDATPWPLKVSPETVLSALEKAELAQTNRAGDDRAERFAFGHRRLLEFFATKAVIDGGSGVSAETLLNDDRWRETAVTILNSDVGERGPLLDALRRSLTASADTLGVPATIDGQPLAASGPSNLRKAVAPLRKTAVPERSQWPTRAAHRLGILQDASVRRAQIDLAQTDLAIRHEADRLLIAAMELGIMTDQKRATDLAAAGSPEGTLFVLKWAFQSHQYVLADAAYKQTLRLRSHIPTDLLAFIRESLLGQWATGALEKDAENVRVQLRRLDSARKDATCSLEKTFWMLRAFSRIDNALLSAFVIPVAIWFAMISDNPLQVAVVCFGLSCFYWAGRHDRAGLRKQINARRNGKTRSSLLSLLSRSVLWGLISPRAIVFCILLVGWWPMLAHGAFGEWEILMLYLLLGALYWWIWRYCAPLAILTGAFLEYHKWPLLFLAPVRVIPSLIKRARLYSPKLTSESVFVFLWASLWSAFIVGFFVPIGEILTRAGELLSIDLGQPQESGIYAVLILMLPWIPIQVSFTIRSRRVLSAAKSSLEGYSAIKLLDIWKRLSPFQTWNEQALFARWVRENEHIIVCEESRLVLLDVIKAIERDHRQKLQFLGFKRPPIDPSWIPEFQAWYRKRAPRLFGLADWHGTPLNELQLLLEPVETGLKGSAACQSTWPQAHTSIARAGGARASGQSPSNRFSNGKRFFHR